MGRLEQPLVAYAKTISLNPDSFDALYGHVSVKEMLDNRAQAACHSNEWFSSPVTHS